MVKVAWRRRQTQVFFAYAVKRLAQGTLKKVLLHTITVALAS